MFKKSFIAGIVIFMGVTGNSLYGVATGAEQYRATIYTTSQGKMVLDSKGENYVLVCQRRFEVTSNTVIKDEMETDITLEELSIPCEAMVSYYEKLGKRNTYVAVSIEVQSKPKPEPE
jgi:hypothetical protein